MRCSMGLGYSGFFDRLTRLECIRAMRKFANGFLAVLAGFIAWFFVATLGNFVLRAVLPGYAVVEKAMSFTLTMLLSRLLLGAISSIGAGVICSVVSGSRRVPGYVLAASLLALFVPVHIDLWEKFPVWYHLIFLGSLMPLSLLGTRLFSKHDDAVSERIVLEHAVEPTFTAE